MTHRVLVIAAHPDDEVLGCGGTAALHVRAGHEVTAVIACEGESLRYGPEGVGQPEHIRRAARVLGLRETRQLGFADQRLDTLSLVDLITPLEQKLCAMACYESEVRPYPHPRSLDALRHRARAWGNHCCLDAAEVFMTVRRSLRGGQTPV